MELEIRIESIGPATLPGEEYTAEFYHVIDSMPLLDAVAEKGGKLKLSSFTWDDSGLLSEIEDELFGDVEDLDDIDQDAVDKELNSRGEWFPAVQAKETAVFLLAEIDRGSLKQGQEIPERRKRVVNLEGLTSDLKRMIQVLEIACQKNKRIRFFVS